MKFCIQSGDSPDKVQSIRGHGNNQDLVIVPESDSDLLVSFEVPDAELNSHLMQDSVHQETDKGI